MKSLLYKDVVSSYNGLMLCLDIIFKNDIDDPILSSNLYVMKEL